MQETCIIGAYRHARFCAPSLAGAARDLSTALSTQGCADSSALRSGFSSRSLFSESERNGGAAGTPEATLDGFNKAWDAAVKRSVRGDVLFLTFSGHGIRVPETGQKTSPDGYEKGFLLQPYDEHNAANEILTDEALYDRFQQATAVGLKIVFVADACHSGAAVRGLDKRGAKGAFRFQRFDTTSAPLSQDIASSPVVARPANPDVTIFSATDERLSIQEIVIDNAYRGALSYAFARGIDTGQPNGSPVTAGELRDYVGPVVRLLSGNRQIPQFAVPAPDLVLTQPKLLAPVAANNLPTLNVSVSPSSSTPASAPDGITFVSGDMAASLTWDASNNQLLDSNGDLLASGVSAATLPGPCRPGGSLKDFAHIWRDSPRSYRSE